MDVSLTELSNAPTLDSWKRLFQESRDMTATSRETSKKHRRYYDGKVDDKLKARLSRAKKPTFNINRVRPGIEGMIGVVERGKSDPIARPKTPQDQDGSEVATEVLRSIDEANRWQQNKLKAFRNFLVESTAACLVEVDKRLDVRKVRIRFEEFIFDPYSREPDFSDASYMGIAKWQYVDAIIASYPEHEAALRLAVTNTAAPDAMFEDRPESNTSWTDPKRKRLLTVEMYHLHGGQWLKCVFVGDLKLEEGLSPYLDEWDEPCNPIEAISAYVDDENNRYGAVEDMVGPQDEINTYRRNAAHRSQFRQVQESDTISAYADPEEVRREAAKPDGVIPPGYQIVPNDKFPMDMALLQEAKGEIERTSVNPAIVARGDSNSGRQDLIRQQAGLTEQAHLYGALEEWDERLQKQAWNRVRQFWKEHKYIRATKNEKAYEFIQINEPIMGPPAPVIDPITGVPQYDPVTRQVVMQPQILGMKNVVSKMGVDIIIDNTPDTANVAQEQYQALVDLARSGVPIPPKVLIEASSLPKKREILEALEQAEQQSQQQPDPRAEAAFDLEMRTKAAGIEKTTAQADQARAAAVKTMNEAEATEMQTRWMTAPQPGF